MFFSLWRPQSVFLYLDYEIFTIIRPSLAKHLPTQLKDKNFFTLFIFFKGLDALIVICQVSHRKLKPYHTFYIDLGWD